MPRQQNALTPCSLAAFRGIPGLLLLLHTSEVERRWEKTLWGHTQSYKADGDGVLVLEKVGGAGVLQLVVAVRGVQ